MTAMLLSMLDDMRVFVPACVTIVVLYGVITCKIARPK